MKESRLQEKLDEKPDRCHLVPTADFHESEYVGEYFKYKISYRFTGSAGTAVITMNEACLWVDGSTFGLPRIKWLVCKDDEMGRRVRCLQEYLEENRRAAVGFCRKGSKFTYRLSLKKFKGKECPYPAQRISWE